MTFWDNIRSIFVEKSTHEKRIYLDYAAATPIRKEVLEVMQPFFTEQFGNASAIHAEGISARKAIESARKELATVLKIRKEDVIFTSGGTESNHLALSGCIEWIHLNGGRAYADMHIVTTEIEHPSVLEAVSTLQAKGVRVTYLPVTEEGLVEQEVFESSLTTETVLISIAYVNSEIGVVQDIKRLTRGVRAYEREHGTSILVHVDASQAPLWLPCQLDQLGVEMMTLDAGKCYGPKGVGVLAFRHGVKMEAMQRGGSQESGLRAGTENTPFIIGAVEAFTIAQASWKERSVRVAKVRDFFISELLHTVSGSILNGPSTERVANNVNISIPGIDTEFAVVVLDSMGVAASTKSACAGGDSGGSTVVFALHKDIARAASTMRFSLGETTVQSDVAKVVRILHGHVHKMRAFHETHTPKV